MTSAKAPSPGLRLAVDYGPLLVFFAVNFFAPAAPMVRLVAGSSGFLSDVDRMGAIVIARVICATAAFILATLVAMIFSRAKLGHVSAMLWISGALVVVFGGLTIWFHDPRFIQMKPTFVYGIFAGTLAFGLWSDRPLLQGLLGSTYPGLSDLGWRRLTRNWAVFFAGMAVLNEAVRAVATFDGWLLFKVWGAIPLTLVFALANVPMLLRHGLQAGDAVAEVPPE